MTEMEPHQGEIDGLLRRSLAAPIPSLPSDFDKRLMREVSGRSRSLDRYRRMLFVGYGLTSVMACVVMMRGQGLGWGPIAGMVLATLALVTVVRSTWRATHKTMGHSHG